jgi:hypothetical protein
VFYALEACGKLIDRCKGAPFVLELQIPADESESRTNAIVPHARTVNCKSRISD